MSGSAIVGRNLIVLLITWISFSMIMKPCLSEHPDVLAELPNQPMVFNSPEELRTYLQELDKYFAIVGRPRFGRTAGLGFPKSFFPFLRANGFPTPY